MVSDFKILERQTNRIAGLAFAVANCFANLEAAGSLSFAFAAITGVVVTLSFSSRRVALPLEINSIGMAVTGCIVLIANAPTGETCATAAVDFLFAFGNALAARQDNFSRLRKLQTSGLFRAFGHPATFYGFAYILTGMLASRFLSPASTNVYAISAMIADIAMTIFSITGITMNKLKEPAAPYMAVAAGSLFGVVAAIFSGNLAGALNKLFSATGEFSLAVKETGYLSQSGIDPLEQNSELVYPSADDALLDHIYYRISQTLLWAPRFLMQLLQGRV